MPVLTPLVLAGLLQSSPGVHQEFHPDGSLHVEVEMGRYRGELVRNGKFRRLAPDGVELAVGRYKDGLARGKWTFRYPGGKIYARGYFSDDQHSGEWEFRHENGKRWAKGECADGQRTGEWAFFDDRGKDDALHSGVYAAGVLRDEAGEPLAGGALLDGLPHGFWQARWPDGSFREAGVFRRGKRVGPWRFRHRDGTREDDLLGELGGETVPWPRLPLADGWAEAGEAEEIGELPRLVEPGSDVLKGVIKALTERPAEDDRGPKLALQHAPASVPVLIDALVACDLADAKGADRAARLHRGLEAVCRGRSFGWSPGNDALAVRQNRARVRRWHSLWSATSRDPVVWNLRMGSRPLEGGRSLTFDAWTAGSLVDPARVRPWPEDADPAITEGIENALEWLVAHQNPDGAWSSDGFGARCGGLGDGKCDGLGDPGFTLGTTGLALLALQRAGQRVDAGEHREAVARGIGWLLRAQSASGHFGRRITFEHIYCHAAATWALAEALADLPPDRVPELRDAVRRGLDVVLAARNPGEFGAWRYDLTPSGEADTSVTGWMVHALAAGRRAGLVLDQEPFDAGRHWVMAMMGAGGRIGYDSPGSVSARSERNVDEFPHELGGESMTALGIMIRSAVEGDRLPLSELEPQAQLLRRKLPTWDPPASRDMYYWFWGAQAARLLGDSTWKAWSKALKPVVLYHQETDGDRAGSWSATGAWAHAGGRLYTTSILAMSLCELAQG